MNAKKVLGFVFCTSAFSQRNISTILLVAVLFGGYLLAGGKVSTTLPELRKAGTFGGIDTFSELNNNRKKENGSVKDNMQGSEDSDFGTSNERKLDPESVLGIKPTEDKLAREEALLKRGRTFLDEDAGETKPIDKSGLIQGTGSLSVRQENLLQKNEKRSSDSLSAIEDRLNIRRR